MKRILSLVLVLSMITGMVVITSADEPSSWAKTEVEAAVEAGLVPEYIQKDWTSPITRGQVSEMFIRLLEKATGKTVDDIIAEKGAVIEEGKFEDTDDGNVYAANALGIINGTSSSKFSPDGTLKRAQIAALINRVAKVVGVETEGYTHHFEDITDNYSWVDAELGWPSTVGIINGVSSTKFNPGGDLTTEQAILITYRALTALKSEMSLINPDPAKRVIIFGVDGAGDFFKDADTPRIDEIFASGAITHNAAAASPSYSGVNWGSILHGSDHEVHRLNNSSDTPFPVISSVPSIFKVVRDSYPDADIASIVHWEIINKGIIEDADAIGIFKDSGNDARVCSKVMEYLDSHDPKLLYMHFDDVDEAGHSTGYGSPTYLQSISNVDGYIGMVYDKLAERGLLDDTVLILTPDHGGTYKTDDDGSSSGSHGGSSDEELTCMVAITGKNVQKGEFGNMMLKDIASIVLYALGIRQPDGYTSMVPSGVFEGVEAGTRPVYHESHHTRFAHEGESTPVSGSGSYITDFFPEEEIISYSSLDGTVKNEVGKTRVTGKGKVLYTDGYYDTSVDVSEGGFILSSYAPDTSSFSVSFWFLVKPTGEDGPVMTNQYYYRYKYVEGEVGTTLSLDGSSLRVSVGKLYSVDGGESGDEWYVPLPFDYREGWVHADFIVNREDNKIGVSLDFGDTVWFEIPDEFKNEPFSGNTHGLLFGTDVTVANLSLPLEYDDIIIFNKALTSSDINKLAEYYRYEPLT